MAKKPTVTTLQSGFNSTETLNANFEALRDSFDNTLSLDGSTPNAMEADLDLNGNNIIGAAGLLINGTDYLVDVEAAKTAALAAQAAAETAETNAETAETNAESSETAAGLSATAAATSATAAASSASAAAASATSIGNAETNSANSAEAAAASQVSAAKSASSVAGIFENFDDKYLGSKAVEPTTDNSGNALVIGALYYSQTASSMYVWDGAAWVASSSAGTSSFNSYNYTATDGQTSFSGSDDNSLTLTYTVNNIIVTLNGLILENGTDYTASTGNSIILTDSASLNDELNIVAFKSFEVADTVSASAGGTFSADVTFSSNIIVNGTVDGRDVASDGLVLDGLASPTAGAVGTYAWLVNTAQDGGSAWGATVSGSSLRSAGIATNNNASINSDNVTASGRAMGTLQSGTWRAMGQSNFSGMSYSRHTLFVRIS